MNYFVTAISTDSGKTLFSSILTEFLKSDYWKPVQSGLPRDTETVQSLITNKESRFWPESYFMNTPMSPHASAAIDGVEIDLNKINLPDAKRNLVIEGAGGLLVPLNDRDYVIDLAVKFKAEVILVSNHYLGSINHTLLSLDYLEKRGVNVKGIVFNGNETPSTEEIILKKTKVPCLLRIKQEEKINKGIVTYYANQLGKAWEKIG
jgi:dethiobiotin synthetase